MRGRKAEVTAAEFPATFADGKSSREEPHVRESEEEKWRIELHENTDALRTNGVSNLRLERRRFVSHNGDTTDRNVVFILLWKNITAMLDTGIRSNYANIFVYRSITNFYSPDYVYIDRSCCSYHSV